MAKKKKTGRPPKGPHKDIVLRIYDKEYPGLKEFIEKISQSSNETQNDYIIKIMDRYKASIEFNKDPQKLSNTFILFNKNIQRKINSYKEILIKEDYLKKKSIKDLIYNIYPDKIERQHFYLNLINTQFNSEFTLLDILISNISSHFFPFLCEIGNLTFNEDRIIEIYNNLIFNFQLNWFNELKFNRVISNTENLETVNFNFGMLEKFILKMYNGYQKQLSFKEKREESLLNKQRKKETIPVSLKSSLKGLFREIVKDFNGLSLDTFKSEENEYILFHKIKYKPSEFFFKLIKIDDYLAFIEKHNLSKTLSDFIKKYSHFYHQINSIPSLPLFDLTLDIKIFFSRFEVFEAFLKKLPAQINKNQYDLRQIKEIGMKLRKIWEDNYIYSSSIKEGIEVIPIENLSILTDLPESFLGSYKFIRYYLKKRGFDVESESDKIKNKVEQRLLDRKLILHDLLKPEAKKRFSEILLKMKNE